MASGDGSTTVAGLADGRVLRWTFADPHPHLIFRLHGQVTSLAVDRTGSVIAASDGADAKLWRDGRTVVRLSVPAGQRAGVVAVSPSGRTVVLSGVLPVKRGVPSTFGVESIVIFSVPRMTVMSVHRNPWNSFSWSGLTSTNYIVAPSDDQVVLFDLGYGDWERRAIHGWSLTGGGNAALGTHQASGTPAANGEYFTATNGTDTIPVWRTRGQTSNSDFDYTAQAPLSGVGELPVLLRSAPTALAWLLQKTALYTSRPSVAQACPEPRQFNSPVTRTLVMLRSRETTVS